MNFWSYFRITISQKSWNSSAKSKKDDDYELRFHPAIMREINKYKNYDLKELTSIEINQIAEDVISLVKNSGDFYHDEVDTFYEELRELRDVLLLKNRKLRKALKDLIWDTEGINELASLWSLHSLERYIDFASLEDGGLSRSDLRKYFGGKYLSKYQCQ